MFHKNRPPVGARPGTLAIDENAVPPVIKVLDYDPDGVREESDVDVSSLNAYLDADTVTWIDVQGLGDAATIKALGAAFGFHRLAMADVVNTPQRPKLQVFDGHSMFVTRMAYMSEDGRDIVREQVSLFVGTNYVITFQERYGDVFGPVRARLREALGPIRTLGPDYLAYALVDTVIDGYYPVLEVFGDRLEELESRAVTEATTDVLEQIYTAKRELLALRRGLWPHREAIGAIVRGDAPSFTADVQVYFRDVYDHCMQLIDVLETYREMAASLLDVYLSSMGQRTNEVMKVLTIIASVFIPLTFLAGIYGMNFEFMPELRWRWAYPTLLVAMVLITVGLFAAFRRRRWIGESPRPPSRGPGHPMSD